MTNIEQLKQLVLDGGFDEESRKAVSELEDRLHKILVAENLLTNPIIQEYIDHLKAESSRCTLLLSRDKNLSELERLNLFDKRDLCDKFARFFTGEEKESIEQTINELIDVAKN